MSNNCIFCAAEWVHELTDECSQSAAAVIETGTRLAGGQVKDGANMKDVESTGRKRAAAIAVIEPGMVCEWAYLKAAGGGVKPLIGCTGNPAADVHHGPDKSTLNNELGVNLHRICKHCHHRWHSVNDPYYIKPRPAEGAAWIQDQSLCGEMIVKPHDGKTKITKAAALYEEMQRQQDDVRGKI